MVDASDNNVLIAKLAYNFPDVSDFAVFLKRILGNKLQGTFNSQFINSPPEWRGVNAMGEVRGIVASEAEEKFRVLAMKKFGYGKGSLSKALEEALLQWIQTCETEGST